MIKIRTFASLDLLIAETLDLLRHTLPKAGSLMLSGGSTPYVIYNQLAAEPCPVHPQCNLFLSDERLVPPDSLNNNAANLMPMLQSLDCEDRFIRVNTLLPAPQAAAQFANDLHSIDPIDLGFLGMGDDGHTAGFFTLEQARQKTGPLTLSTDRPDGMQGVSITPALLPRVERLIVLVTGESKREIIETLLHQPESIPAGIALSGHPHVELWTELSMA
jgi:6-phosphogluconolactonase